MFRKILSVLTAVSLVTCTTAALADDEAARNASLTVLTGGERCSVYVDDKLVGESPLRVPVTAGKHKVEVKAQSGEIKSRSVTLKANEANTVRFDFPISENLPNPVQDAVDGNFPADRSWSWREVGYGIGGICIIGGAIVLAYNYGSSGGLSGVEVNQRNITLAVRTNLGAADGDIIDIEVNGVKLLDDYTLTAADNVVNVNLNAGSNLVEIKAENVGTSPPNTGILTISNVTRGSSVQDWSLSAGDRAHMRIVAP